jgi:hypothetical protein
VLKKNLAEDTVLLKKRVIVEHIQKDFASILLTGKMLVPKLINFA